MEKSKSKEKSFKRQAIWLWPLGGIVALLASCSFSKSFSYLRETLPKEERILYELKGNTQMPSILNASPEKRKVHDKKALKQLKYQLKIWKNLGSEYREYLKNSQNGYLTENQKLDLRIQGIDEELYENYLREQNRLLIMKKF